MSVSHPDRGDSPPVAERASCGRNPDGTFARLNVAALKHGVHSRPVRDAELPEHTAMRAQLADKRAAILEDLGGDSQVSQLQHDLIDRYLELDSVASRLGGNLLAAGPLTAKGRTRAALSAYVTVVDRVHRIATALGLGRRQKQASLNDYLTTTYEQPRGDDESDGSNGGPADTVRSDTCDDD